MLGEHAGLEPLADRGSASKILLRSMGRIGSGKDVPFRQKVISRAIAAVPEGDRYWMESLSSALAGDSGIQADQAMAVTFAVAFEMDRDGLSRLLLEVNQGGSDAFSATSLRTLMTASPSFGRRLKENRVDSDEVFFRVAMLHLFRRDPSSTFQVFSADNAAILAPRCLKLTTGDILKQTALRPELQAAPEWAWGYALVLRNLRSKQGLYVPNESPQGDAMVSRAVEELKAVGVTGSDDEIRGHLVGAACSQMSIDAVGSGGNALLAATLRKFGPRFSVIYISDEEDGVSTTISEMPCSSVEEARRLVQSLPEVLMHDDFRRLAEIFEQKKDEEEARASAS